MNLILYDVVNEKIDKTKTWIYPSKYRLFSREFNTRKYYYIGKRYNKDNDTTNYYLIFTDKCINKSCKLTNIDNFGRFNINVRSIWKYTTLKNITKPININIKLIEDNTDSTVYYLDV